MIYLSSVRHNSTLKQFFLIFALFISGVSSAQTHNENSQYQLSDPFEPVNRVMWDFNYQILDAYIYRPVTESYVGWVPASGRKAINNFVLNFDEPSTMVNNLLQLEFKHSLKAFFRFSVNSTFGILGVFDVAKKLGVERRRETFANVLGRWYVPNGPYLMMPVIGPTTPRKLVGNFIDGLYFPFSYLTVEEEVGIRVFDALDQRESLLGQEPLIEQSLDPYLFVKDAYIQHAAFKLNAKSAETVHLLQEESSTLEEEVELDLDEFMDEIE